MNSAPPTREPVSNAEFGRAVGVHFTTASRLRNGERLPSTRVASRIIRVYGLDPGETLNAIAAGGTAFGHFLRMNVFGPEPAVDLNEDGSERLVAA